MGRVKAVAAVLPGACVESVAFGPAASDWVKCEVLSVESARDTAATGGVLSAGDAVETVDNVAMTHSQLHAYLRKRAKLAPRDTVSIVISRPQPVPSPGGARAAAASSSPSLSLLPPAPPLRRGGGTALPRLGAEEEGSQPRSPHERARASAPPSTPSAFVAPAEFVSINAAIAAAPLDGKTGIVLRGGVCVLVCFFVCVSPLPIPSCSTTCSFLRRRRTRHAECRASARELARNLARWRLTYEFETAHECARAPAPPRHHPPPLHHAGIANRS